MSDDLAARRATTRAHEIIAAMEACEHLHMDPLPVVVEMLRELGYTIMDPT